MKLCYVTPDRHISDDIGYFIDCAVEAMDMPYDVAFWLRYMCNDPGVLVNGPNQRPHREDPEELWVRTAVVSDAIERSKRAFERWWNNPKTLLDEKIICAAVGMSSVRHIVRDTAKFISECVIVEQTKNSMAFRSLEADTRIVRKFKRRKITRTGGHYAIHIHDWKPCLDNPVPTKNMTDLRAMIDRVNGLPDFADDVQIVVTPSRRRSWREYDRDHRKVIRRGIELLNDLIGEQAVRDFLRTKKLEIKGEKFSIHMELEHLKESHGGARTRIYVGEDEICSLCVYTPETPILDHIASVITHVRAGLEDDVIETGNPYSVKVTEKTGVSVLDKRLFPECSDNPRRERIVVDSIPIVNYVRIGDSLFTKALHKKAVRRISGYLYQHYLAGSKLPRANLRFTYPRELQSDEYFNIPTGFVLRSNSDLPYDNLDPMTRALIQRLAVQNPEDFACDEAAE